MGSDSESSEFFHDIRDIKGLIRPNRDPVRPRNLRDHFDGGFPFEARFRPPLALFVKAALQIGRQDVGFIASFLAVVINLKIFPGKGIGRWGIFFRFFRLTSTSGQSIVLSISS